MNKQRHTDFYIPVLKILEDLKEHEVNSLISDTANLCKLTDEERKIRTRKGTQLKFESNIQWAITDLYQGGFINRTERGVYTIAFDGLLILEDNPEHPDRDYLESRSEKFSDFRHRKGTRNKNDGSSEINLFSNLQDEDIDQDESSRGVVKKVSEVRISSDANEMLKKCLAAKKAMILAEIDTTQVDAKIKLLQEGILRNTITADAIRFVRLLKNKNLNDVAIIIDLFSPDGKVYLMNNVDLASHFYDSATLLCDCKEEDGMSTTERVLEKHDASVAKRKNIKKSKAKSQRKKAPSQGLRVTFDDGTVVEGKFASDVFARTIEKIGAEKVMNLGLTSCGVPLVGREAPVRYQYRGITGGYYIPVTSSTINKKKILDDIASRLNITLDITVV